MYPQLSDNTKFLQKAGGRGESITKFKPSFTVQPVYELIYHFFFNYPNYFKNELRKFPFTMQLPYSYPIKWDYP